jgi:hypothetical protein
VCKILFGKVDLLKEKEVKWGILDGFARTKHPTPHFFEKIRQNLTYWQKET